MAVEIGQPAPDFALKNTAGDTVTLADFAGQPLLLVFYPFTFTGICEGELCRIRDDYSQFESAGVQVAAVSCDSKNSQKVWSEQQGYTFP
jgi:peroxiredoxin